MAMYGYVWLCMAMYGYMVSWIFIVVIFEGEFNNQGKWEGDDHQK